MDFNKKLDEMGLGKYKTLFENDTNDNASWDDTMKLLKMAGEATKMIQNGQHCCAERKCIDALDYGLSKRKPPNKTC